MVTIATGQVAGNSKDGKVLVKPSHAPKVRRFTLRRVFVGAPDSVSFPIPQPLLPHVRVWDSVTLNTLHVVGMGAFDRAVTCVAFSKSVRRSCVWRLLRSEPAVKCLHRTASRPSQNGGAFLCAVDDANDHILSVWNWQKEKQLAEVKVSHEFHAPGSPSCWGFSLFTPPVSAVLQ